MPTSVFFNAHSQFPYAADPARRQHRLTRGPVGFVMTPASLIPPGSGLFAEDSPTCGRGDRGKCRGSVIALQML
ncbi:hypothetical protein CgunFtcFv8_012545 [Champsocephalus gunnari]|uniref:Uncharacterized protein n=1 Tax=Champsocephalus gunnari TaxID=52237 RepID=A0AAN8HT46_CHAGU|nr:hypothetical protein CgunFtcFv8_012545 [Champsocephalus gunnari]